MTVRDLPRPRDWQAFEDLCCDLFREYWKAPFAQKHGRQGQPQAGVDVFGMPGGGPAWAGVQCKRSADPLTETVLEAEVEKAKGFEPSLSTFILATTAPRDNRAQAWARELTASADCPFEVSIFAWNDICEFLDGQRELLEKHFPDVVETDPADLRKHYLAHLWERLNRIPIGHIASGAQDERRIRLSSVYVELDVDSTLRAQGGKAEGEDWEVVLPLGISGDGDSVDALVERYEFEIESLLEKRKTRSSEFSFRRACSALEAAATSRRRVLTGRGGSGKSTFGRYLCLCLAGETLGKPEANLDRLNAGWLEVEGRLRPWPHGRKLPFFVELGKFVDSAEFPKPGEEGLADHLVAFLARQGPAGSDMGRLVLDALGRDGEYGAFLVLDGLDETSQANRVRERLKQVIGSLVRVYPQCRVLVTSRPYAYGAGQPWRLDEAGFREESLAPFDREKISRFVREAYASFAARHRVEAERVGELSEDLLGQLESNPSLIPLASQPLMLTMMADLHSLRQGRLPGGRAALFEESLKLLLDRWNERRGKRSAADLVGMDEEQIREALELLAYRVHRRGEEGSAESGEGSEIPYHELHRALLDTRGHYGNRKLLVPEDICDHLNQRSGILIGESPEVYRFPHRFFQEYLAACHFDRRFPEVLKDALGTRPMLWRESILFLAGRNARDDRLLQLLKLLVAGPPTEPVGAEDARYLEALFAALAIREHRLWERDDADLGEIVEATRLWLRRTVEKGALDPLDRSSAGQVLALLGDDRPGVGLREDGLPDIQWVEYPAGTFLMGGTRDDEGGREHEVTLSAFAISRYPVTNRQFEAFVEDGGYSERHRDCWSEEGLAWLGKGDGPGVIKGTFGLSNHPRVAISWWEAEAFAAWLGRQLGQDIRLPTEAQWERALRGIGGRSYPWGEDAPDPDRSNDEETGIGGTTTVGLFPRGEGPPGEQGYGVLDGLGNVWEWCSDRTDLPMPGYPEGQRVDPQGPESGARRVIRGGCWNVNPREVPAAYRSRYRPGLLDGLLGFRLSRGPDEPGTGRSR